ncbi:S8 family serine peptidase [Spongiactinospora rosea]|uniref:S8 family serine peptidase n=1 Tax=Spongiactinospora rosea TaxID=2248750 RepID=UPI001CEC179C|nr:S8 family serine peptidase [Spongiactinospora rosea]
MSDPLRRRPRPRTLSRALVGLLVVLPILLPQVPAHAEPGAEKITAAVRTDLKDGKATFLVRLGGKADLSAAHRATTKDAKAKAVHGALTAHAGRSQAGLRKLLTERKAEHTPFWIVNAIEVTADPKLANEIAALPEVAALDPVRKDEAQKPRPKPAKAQAKAAAVEWNIDRIGAPRVWDELNDRGEDIVVGVLDTGVDIDHPDLAGQYRGNRPDGSVVHDYSWFDPGRTCPESAPCDRTGHGTHVTGIITGQNGIGVAPGAKWIATAANNSTSGKILAGEWMLAPTDLNGQNPRPELAPDIVNNSWGSEGSDPYYKDMVNRWVDAGIFPVFANGNTGPECDSASSTAKYASSYAVGAVDVNDAIWTDSSRGPGDNGEVKPDIAAPGVNIRSSLPEGEYGMLSGTSMATPHVVATVALMWSAAPSLRGDVPATRALLDGTAIDTADLTCGGTAGNNNVYGEGRLDAYAAVQAVPDDALGDLGGTVTANGSPVSGAEVKVTGPVGRTAGTGAGGGYALLRLPAGTYQVSVSKFGYVPATSTVTIADGQTADHDVTLTLKPVAVVSGTITTDGDPEKDATVVASGTPVKAVTDASGHYQMTLPHGSYQLDVAGASQCVGTATADITVAGNLTKNFDLPVKRDDFGYTCTSGTEPYVAGTEPLTVTPGIGQEVALPFPVPFYGQSRSRIWVATLGFASFAGDVVFDNEPLPGPLEPDLAVYPFWDDLRMETQSGIYTATVGTAPHRSFVIEWRDVRPAADTFEIMSFSALLGEDGTISYRYKDIGPAVEQGSSATIGIENADGTDALQYSYNTASIRDGQSLTFTAKDHGVVRGKVTDANDGQPLAGATVEFPHVATFTTAADGTYGGQVRAGTHQAKVSKDKYGTLTQSVTVPATDVTTNDAALITGKVTASPTSLTLNGTTSATITLTNTGTAPTPYEVTTEDAWLTATPATGGLLQNQSATITVTAASPGPHTGKLLIHSASGRQPTIEIPVTVTAAE